MNTGEQKIKIDNKGLQGIARSLLLAEVIDENVANNLNELAQKNKISFIGALLESGTKTNKNLGVALSEQFGLPLIDPRAMHPEHLPTDLIEQDLIEKHHALPIYLRGTKLYVAVADPMNATALNEIKFNTGFGVVPLQADPEKLLDAIAMVANSSAALKGLASDDEIELDIEDTTQTLGGGDNSADDAPIVKYVNKLLLDAINEDASDIHIEPYEKFFRVRYRIDGVLHEVATQPLKLAGQVIARIKVISRLDIAERRAPQDGRMKLQLSKNKTIDFRVNTCPVVYGEKVVIRLLDAGNADLAMEKLGFTPDQLKLYEDAVKRPYGMVLITGPTGSGKTVSLYTALGVLNTVDRNISTVEDPVEIHVEGINQVNINEKANLTFASALRAFLRQDPDIIMVGEVRDPETAEIAIKAAQTGHLVLSTLHTNDAPATLSRLINMGIPVFNIASAVRLIVAQRLARKLCNSCKKEVNLPAESLLAAGFKKSDLSNIKTYKPTGCNKCIGGYHGRVGIFQVMPIDEEMKRLIMAGASEGDIADSAAQAGVMTLREAALEKVKDGTTSLEEIERITND